MRELFATLLVLALFACGGPAEKKVENEYIQDKVMEYYSNGKIKVEGNTVNGKAHGLWRYYYENGFVWSEGKFRHGKRSGHSLVYYENGKKRLQGNYKEGERVGWWLAWDEQGTFIDSIDLSKSISKRDSMLLGM